MHSSSGNSLGTRGSVNRSLGSTYCPQPIGWRERLTQPIGLGQNGPRMAK